MAPNETPSEKKLIELLAKQPAERLIDRYIELRDQKKAVEDAHKEVLAVMVRKMDKLEAALGLQMQQAKLNALPTDTGTAFIATKYSVQQTDIDLFVNWCKANNLMHLVDSRPSKTGVVEYLMELDQRKEGGKPVSDAEVPVGVQITPYREVQVRRPTKAAQSKSARAARASKGQSSDGE